MSGEKPDVDAWLAKAEEDRLFCEALLKEHAPPSGVCFHTQQMAEKLLKAVITSHNVLPPKEHDLTALATLAAAYGSPLDDIKEELKTLNRYYIEPRYPADVPEFTRAESELAFEAAIRVRDFVREKLLAT